MRKPRSIRQKRAADEEEEEQDIASAEEGQPQALSAEEIKALQKQRQRKTGVEARTLAGEGDKKKPQSLTLSVPEEGDTGALHAAFKQERRSLADDEDADMKHYVEEQLAKRLGKELPEEAAASRAAKRHKTLEELALEAAVPLQKEVDADAGAALLAGVAEVALGVEHRLRNIEATEAAKAALLARGGARAGAGRDDDYEGYAVHGSGQGYRRGQFPVNFGKTSEKEQARRAEKAAMRVAGRARADEQKRKKQTEFRGW